MKILFNYEPSEAKENNETPNADTLEAMKESEEIAAAWRKRKRG